MSTKRALAAVILMGAAFSAPTQAVAANTVAAPPPASAPLGDILAPLLGPLTGALGNPAGTLNTLLPNGILGG